MIYVAKNDCYHLRLSRIIPVIDDYVEFYAVGTIFEADKLRELTIKDILILMPVLNFPTGKNYDKNYTFTISSINDCKNLIEYYKSNRIRAHIKINSGMNRYGVDDKEEYEIVKTYAKNNNISIEGEYTHLISSDKDFCKTQIYKFKQITANSELIKHVTFRETIDEFGGVDFVRSGINVLGCEKNEIGLRQVFRIFAVIEKIRKIKAGEYVGYNFTYKADKDENIAIIRFGYSDMAIKRGVNNINIIVNGKKCVIIGVAMDVSFAIIEDNCCKEFDYAEIIGYEKDNDIFTLAKMTGLSSYELLTTFNDKEI